MPPPVGQGTGDLPELARSRVGEVEGEGKVTSSARIRMGDVTENKMGIDTPGQGKLSRAANFHSFTIFLTLAHACARLGDDAGDAYLSILRAACGIDLEGNLCAQNA
jgi:hypothetical protein